MRSILPALVVALALAPSAVTIADTQQPVRTFRTTEATGRGLLRVFSAPGDFGLENARVVAVIRQTDGQLVDFWQRGNAAPTTPQLGASPPLDGLWAHTQSLLIDGKHTALTLESIRRYDSFVEVEHFVVLPQGRLQAWTRYALASSTPALDLTTRLELRGTDVPLRVAVVDSLKWGNVDYIAAGHGVLPPAFSGDSAWIGRRGAGGDLRLQARPGASFRIDVTSRHPGFRRPVTVTHPANSVGGDSVAKVGRLLAWAPIAPAAPPSVTGRLIIDLIDERGRRLPAKLTFSGVRGTQDPDFGNEGDETGANRFVWSGNGHFDRTLAPGSYAVLATAGIERAAHTFDVTIDAGETTHRAGRLPRVLETPGSPRTFICIKPQAWTPTSGFEPGWCPSPRRASSSRSPRTITPSPTWAQRSARSCVPAPSHARC